MIFYGWLGRSTGLITLCYHWHIIIFLLHFWVFEVFPLPPEIIFVQQHMSRAHCAASSKCWGPKPRDVGERAGYFDEHVVSIWSTHWRYLGLIHDIFRTRETESSVRVFARRRVRYCQCALHKSTQIHRGAHDQKWQNSYNSCVSSLKTLES